MTMDMYSTLYLFLIVPGQVYNFTGRSEQNSVVLTWSPPLEPNGIIIGYELNYRVDSGSLVTINLTDLSTAFTITPLVVLSTVSDISISAYNTIGRGEATSINDICTCTTTCEQKLLLIN